MAHQEQTGGTSQGEEHDKREPFRHVNGPPVGVRVAIDPLEWGKAARYWENLNSYSGPENVQESPFYPDQSPSTIREQYAQLGLPVRELQGGLGKERAQDVPTWADVLHTDAVFGGALLAGSLTLRMIAAEIAGIGEKCYPANGEGLKRIAGPALYEGVAVCSALEQQWERAFKNGATSIEYDGSYAETTAKNATTLLGEYPLYVEFFGRTMERMLDQLPTGFEEQKRDFAEMMGKLRSLRPSTLVYLAKLESILPPASD